MALVGNRGAGKTQIACDAIKLMIGTGRDALYAHAMTYFLDLRATYRSETVAEKDVIERYRRPRLLVIDEAQLRGETDFEQRMLDYLIDLRYGDLSDTLLISNMTPDVLAKALGESISDRLRETGFVLPCKWESFRGRKAVQ